MEIRGQDKMPASLIFTPGQIIGTNEIIEKDNDLTNEKHRGYQKCKCLECGNIRSVRVDNLKTKCKSCAAKDRPLHIKDNLIGKTFGFQKVVDKAKKPNFQICECQNCGTIKEVFRGSLIDGNSKSCGCVSSQGETQISYWLNFYKIEYKKEFSFKDLITDKGGYPRFDFAIFHNNKIYCLIEYDGRQHFNYEENQKLTQNDFLRLQYIDNLKDTYCKEHNIILYRFNKFTSLEEEIKKIYEDIKGD